MELKTIEWGNLPSTVQKNLDIECGYDDVWILSEEWYRRMNKSLEPFNATFDDYDDTFYFESEAHYQWFLLRWL